jgi:hypothetical protein
VKSAEKRKDFEIECFLGFLGFVSALRAGAANLSFRELLFLRCLHREPVWAFPGLSSAKCGGGTGQALSKEPWRTPAAFFSPGALIGDLAFAQDVTSTDAARVASSRDYLHTPY